MKRDQAARGSFSIPHSVSSLNLSIIYYSRIHYGVVVLNPPLVKGGKANKMHYWTQNRIGQLLMSTGWKLLNYSSARITKILDYMVTDRRIT
jgi:hypothetical protein